MSFTVHEGMIGTQDFQRLRNRVSVFKRLNNQMTTRDIEKIILYGAGHCQLRIANPATFNLA